MSEQRKMPYVVEETAGLVEWPVVLMGAFDEDFLDIPDEAGNSCA